MSLILGLIAIAGIAAGLAIWRGRHSAVHDSDACESCSTGFMCATAIEEWNKE